MSWRDWFPFGRKAEPAGRMPVPGWLTLGLMPYQTAFPKGDQLAYGREGYSRNATAFACINEIANTGAGIPWVVMRKTGRSRLEKCMTMAQASKAWHLAEKTGNLRMRKAVEVAKIEEHPWLKLLERPNQLAGGGLYARARYAWYLINGNTYTVKVGPTGKAPRELHVLGAPYVSITPGNKFQPIVEYVFAKGTQYEEAHAAATVCHIKTFNPIDPLYGLSPVQAAALAIDSDNEAARWNLSLLQNSARPPGAFVTDQILDDPDYKKLKAEVHRKSGAKAAGTALVLDAGLKWVPFALSPADMDWLDGRKASRVEICMIYGVPPELVGDNDHKTYNSYPEARKAFYHETVLPLMDIVREEDNRFLGDDFGNDFLDYDRDQIEAIQEDRTQVYVRAETVSYLTVNEKRRMVGEDDYVPGEGPGDSILVDSGKVKLEDLGAMAEGAPGEALPGEPDPKPAPGGPVA